MHTLKVDPSICMICKGTGKAVGLGMMMRTCEKCGGSGKKEELKEQVIEKAENNPHEIEGLDKKPEKKKRRKWA